VLGIIGNKREGWGGVASCSFISSLSLSLCYNNIVGRGGRRGVAGLGIPWHHCHWNLDSLKPPKLKEHWEFGRLTNLK